jgi:hypothetical protein
MKTLKMTLAAMLIMLSSMTIATAQEAPQMYAVHLDHVKPAKVGEYEALGKQLITQSKTHGSNYGWLALVTDQFDYYYVSPINNMAQLDGNPFASLEKKMGSGELKKLFDKMDQCYDDHVNYTISLDKELSYAPNGLTQTPEGQPFRKNTLYYIAPKNYAAAEQLAKDFKALYTKKGSKVNYRLYRSGFGADGTYFMVAVAAKNATEYEKMAAENNQLLGEEGRKLVNRLMGLISKTNSLTGVIRSDLSYSPMK